MTHVRLVVVVDGNTVRFHNDGQAMHEVGLGLAKTNGDIHAKNLLLVRMFPVNSKFLTSKFWFSRGLMSNILV